MGIAQLWQALRETNAVVRLTGIEQHQSIVQQVDQLVIAVDLSIWVVEALTQVWIQLPCSLTAFFAFVGI
jgi:phosphoribulokinase